MEAELHRTYGRRTLASITYTCCSSAPERIARSGRLISASLPVLQRASMSPRWTDRQLFRISSCNPKLEDPLARRICVRIGAYIYASALCVGISLTPTFGLIKERAWQKACLARFFPGRPGMVIITEETFPGATHAQILRPHITPSWV